MYYIYELIDPRTHLKAVRYVGITADLEARYKQHLLCGDGGPEKREWIKGLLDEQLRPMVHTLEIVEDKTVAFEREKYWIATYINQGAELLNVQHGTASATPVYCTQGYSSKVTLRYFKNPSTERRVKENLQNLPRIEIEESPVYSLEILFDQLPFTLPEISEKLNIPEYGLKRALSGDPVSVNRAKLILTFLSQIYGISFTLSNVDGISVLECADLVMQSIR